MANAAVIVDADTTTDLTDTVRANINSIIARAKSKNWAVFYVLPEGADVSEDIEIPDVFSILYYDPEGDDPYNSARIDEQITNRGIDRVQFYGPGTKPGNFSQKEKARGRERYAGSPKASNRPEWAAE